MTAGEAVPNLHSRASPSALMKHCNQSLAQSKEKLLLSRLAARLWRLDIPLLRELDDLASAFMVPTLNGMGLCQDGHPPLGRIGGKTMGGWVRIFGRIDLIPNDLD
jgi:hypothetical protein